MLHTQVWVLFFNKRWQWCHWPSYLLFSACSNNIPFLFTVSCNLESFSSFVSLVIVNNVSSTCLYTTCVDRSLFLIMMKKIPNFVVWRTIPQTSVPLMVISYLYMLGAFIESVSNPAQKEWVDIQLIQLIQQQIWVYSIKCLWIIHHHSLEEVLLSVSSVPLKDFNECIQLLLINTA